MYGRSRKGTRSYRGSASRNYRKPYSRMLKTAPYTGRRGTYKTGLRFATVGFSRDTEKKYKDMALVCNSVMKIDTGMNSTKPEFKGMTFTSMGWNAYDFYDNSSPNAVSSNDLLKKLPQGTDAQSRVGNKIRGRWIKGAFTLCAAKLAGPSSGVSNGDMNGEARATASDASTIWQYLRTSWRVVIVKDLQVNSVDTKIDWNDVFKGNVNSVGEAGGIHAEMNVANMGRFRIISDKLYKTDAVNPQETIRFWIPGSEIGNVRYNGPSADALTDKGIYIIWAAYTSGVTAGLFNTDSITEGMEAPTFTMHCRLAFTDA
uniref:Capsid protein n=1 Tax=Red panda feces-associated circular DNA virus 23 TaxID=2863977 RepID=A0A8K1HIR4_9VIRU|nr:capsid protein [Red panda feces-associated circular DNA virus 23]